MSWLDTLEDIRKKDFAKASAEERERAARDVVNLASYACAVVAVSPIPFSDAVLMLPVQTAMVVTVGHVYGRKLTQADAKELIVELGATAGVGMLARQGIKALLPVVGALLTVPAAFAANWAIGRVAMEYFRSPGAPREQLRQVYEAARQEGARLFSRERFDAFRRSKQSPPRASEGEAEPPAEPPPAPEKKPKKKKPARAGKAAAARSPVERLMEEELPARVKAHPEVGRAIGGVVHLEVSGQGGGRWTVDPRDAGGPVTRELTGTPRLALRCGAEVLEAMLAGQQSPAAAVMAGTLKIEPMDLDLAMKLAPLFA